MAKKINCLYFNARSIKNKFDTMKHIIKDKDSIIHFLLICETSLFENDIQNFTIENYQGYFNSSNLNINNHGTAIFIHNSINAVLKEENNYCNTLVIEILNFYPRFHLGILYNSVTEDIDNCIQHLDNILSRYNNLLVLADINIDLLEETTSVQDYKKCVSKNGYNLLSSIESQCGIKFGRIIDHAITNLKENIEINTELGKNHENKPDNYLFLLTLKEKKQKYMRRIRKPYIILQEHNYATTKYEEYVSDDEEHVPVCDEHISDCEEYVPEFEEHVKSECEEGIYECEEHISEYEELVSEYDEHATEFEDHVKSECEEGVYEYEEHIPEYEERVSERKEHLKSECVTDCEEYASDCEEYLPECEEYEDIEMLSDYDDNVEQEIEILTSPNNDLHTKTETTTAPHKYNIDHINSDKLKFQFQFEFNTLKTIRSDDKIVSQVQNSNVNDPLISTSNHIHKKDNTIVGGDSTVQAFTTIYRISKPSRAGTKVLSNHKFQTSPIVHQQQIIHQQKMNSKHKENN